MSAARRFSLDLTPDAPCWRLVAAALLAAAAVLVTATAGDYGYNVDEWLHGRLGVALADWYAGLLRAEGYRPFAAELEPMNYYGGAFELPAELASRLAPFDRTTTRHLVSAWVAVAALAGTYLLGCSVGSRAVGALAVLLLLFTPRFYGESWSNPKDMPFAACTIWGLYLICRALPHLPRLSWARVLALGGVLGLGLGVRVGAVVTFAYLGLAVAWWAGSALLAARRPAARDWTSLAAALVAIAALSWIVMLAWWPWAQIRPVAGPLQALHYYGNLDEHAIDFNVFFEGRDFVLHEVPRRFTLVFFLLSMPEFALLAPLGLVTLARWARARPPGYPSVRTMSWILVAASVALPLATTASWKVAQYDGTRHFLFVMPSMAVLLAGTLAAAFRAAPRPLGAALALVAAGLVSVTARDMMRLHPYEYVYFNRSIGGGTAAASRRFETDYLGLSYREAMRWLVANAAVDGRQVRVTHCPGFDPNLADALAAVPGAADRFVAVSPWDPSEIALALTRDHCNERFEGALLQTIERAGAPLLQIIHAR